MLYNIIGDVMGEFLIYIFKGLLHYFNLLFGMLDFKDLGFMWFIMLILVLCIIISKEVRSAINGLIKSFVNVIKTLPGLVFFILFIGYYSYVAIFFEEKITLILLIFSLYLFIQTYINVNMDLLAESENSIVQTIKNFSIPVILLCVQQIALMLENNNFDNLKVVLLSLMIIPIFLVLFIIIKHYCTYDDFYKRYKKYIKIDDFSFFKIYNESLILCKKYKTNNILLAEFIKDNQYLSYQEMQKKINEIFPKVISIYERNNKKELKNKKIVKKQSKLFITFNNIWIINIICLIICVLLKRFLNINYNFCYYWIYAILIIYFWYDLMKLKGISNQFDFVIYMVIYIVFICLLVMYSNSLTQFRITELGFIIPIFIYIRYKTFYKRNLYFLSLPFLSEKNFFGLNPSDYNTKKKERR